MLEGEVWKPLDGRPYANAEHHYPTKEAEALEALKGHPAFPKNWRVEESNGRMWLVRPKLLVLGNDFSFSDITKLKDFCHEVEDAVRYMNSANWLLNDDISVALDKHYTPTILDLSCAQYMISRAACDSEWWRVEKFLNQAGMATLVERRIKAHGMITQVWLHAHVRYSYVYGSYYRPFSTLWATMPTGCHYVHNAVRNNIDPHTWILTDKMLPDDTVYRYELFPAWAEWPMPIQKPNTI